MTLFEIRIWNVSLTLTWHRKAKAVKYKDVDDNVEDLLSDSEKEFIKKKI